MAAELEKLARDLKVRGYDTGANRIHKFAQRLLREENIPDSLRSFFHTLPRSPEFHVKDAFQREYPELPWRHFAFNAKATLIIDTPEEAFFLNHDHLGTQHLLLALTRDGGIAQATLENLGVTTEKTRKIVASMIPKGHRRHMHYSPLQAPVLVSAFDESKRNGRPLVDGVGLLLGLAAHEDSNAMAVLATFKIGPQDLRDAVLDR